MHWASQSLSLPTELIKGFDFWDVIGSHFAAKFQSRNEAMMVCGTILRTIWSNITYRGTFNDRKLYTVIFCFYFIIFSSCLFPSYTSSWTLSIYFFLLTFASFRSMERCWRIINFQKPITEHFLFKAMLESKHWAYGDVNDDDSLSLKSQTRSFWARG